MGAMVSQVFGQDRALPGHDDKTVARVKGCQGSSSNTLSLIFYRGLAALANRFIAGGQRASAGGAGTNAIERSAACRHSFLKAAFSDLVRRAISVETRRTILAWLLRRWGDAYRSRHGPSRSPVLPTSQPTEAINVIGWMRAESGLGESARSTIRACTAAGIRVATIDISETSPWRSSEKIPVFRPAENPDEIPINLFHYGGDNLLTALAAVGPRHYTEKYTIGYWVWETMDFPDSWLPAMEFVDEIWTASSFCQHVLKKKARVPVVRIPHTVQPEIPAYLHRTDKGFPDRGFTFLCMADFVSTPERKNPLGAVTAFERAFGNRAEGVYLVVKINNSGLRPDAMSLLKDAAARNNAIILIDEYLDRSAVNLLVKSCDCFVSLHRSEGFGLPLAEAMFFGKPVIATGWSGNMDFMSPDNSFPVDFRIVELDRTVGQFPRGHHWAEPDLDHAAALMEGVFRDPDLRNQKGAAAAKDVAAKLGPAKVGELIRKRLREIPAESST